MHVKVNGKCVNIPSYRVKPERQDRDRGSGEQDPLHRGRPGRRWQPPAAELARGRQERTSPARSRAMPVRDELQRARRPRAVRRRVLLAASSPALGCDAKAGRGNTGRSGFHQCSGTVARTLNEEGAASNGNANDEPQLARPDPPEGDHARPRVEQRDLRQVHLRAARARLRHHDRQLAASRAARFASGRGHHRGEARRRAARVHHASRTSSKT